MRKRDEVFELRLNNFSGSLALLGNSIIANISFAIYLKRKSISGSSL